MKGKLKIALILAAFGIIPMSGAFADVASTTLTGTRDQLSNAFTEPEKASLVTAINATKAVADSKISSDDAAVLITNAIENTTFEDNTVINNIIDIVEGLGTDVDGKANLQGAGAAGVVATVDENGQYVRSATALADVATTQNVNSIVEGAVSAAVNPIITALDDKAEQSDLTALTTRVTATEGNIGLMPGLTTDAKNNIVSAVNELQGEINTNAAAISEMDTAITNIQNITTNMDEAYIDESELATAIGEIDTGVMSVESGTVAGTIAVDGTNVPVAGLSELATMPVGCMAPGAHCALVVNGGDLVWEPVIE
jgi:hypothetical protein